MMQVGLNIIKISMEAHKYKLINLWLQIIEKIIDLKITCKFHHSFWEKIYNN